MMGVSSFVEIECHTAMLLNDMDISRLMVYAKQIKESKLGKINKEGARTRSNEPSQLKPKKRLHNQDPSMDIRIGFPTKIPKEVAMLLRGLGVLLVGKNI